MKHIIFTLLLCFSVNCFAGQIDFSDKSNLQYNGYIGYQQLNSTANISKAYDIYSPQLGLNLIYNRGNFQFFNQFRYAKDVRDMLVYSFAQYTFHVMNDTDFTVKLGKVQNEVGLYNTTRINPRTRQGIIQPSAIYWGVFENFFTSGVGVESILRIKEFTFTYSVTDPDLTDPEKVRRAFYGNLLTGMNTSFGSHQNFSAAYTPKQIPLTLKGTYSRIDFGNHLNRELIAIAAPKFNGATHMYADIFISGIEYRYEKLIFAAEQFTFKDQSQSWTSFIKLNRGTSYSGTWLIDEHFSLRANYNQYESQNKSFYAKNPWMGYYKDINIGVNYYIKDWMFQIEGHHLNGARSIYLGNETNTNQYKEWYMINFGVVYSF